ncbi:hypothetical protein E8E14_003361 [Neopestalotiopsis sp. 37M]|nr:hypothetical protein E8E14_003361 [Neopestalotiopsis sp. 37M]
MSADSEVLSAGAHVGHILELLEAILLEVDIRTLLVSAQRVNKRWWNVIGNPNFQKRLFFIPDPDATGPIDNPFLAEYFPFCFPVTGYPPRIAKDRTPPVHDHWNKKPRNLTSEECAPIMDRAEAFSREDASWRRMYTHQPPLLGVQRMWENALGVSWRRFQYVPSETDHADTNVTMSMQLATVVSTWDQDLFQRLAP